MLRMEELSRYRANVLAFGTALLSASGYIALGASPPASGAIRVDAATYSGVGYQIKNATQYLTIELTSNYGSVGVVGGNGSLYLFGVAQNKWGILGAAGVSVLSSSQATARFISGSTNGRADRNSADTRDNFVVADSGSYAYLNDGTYSSYWRARASSGEVGAGAWLTGGEGVWLVPETSTAGKRAGIGYWDSSAYTNYRSAVEVASAAGLGTLALMRAGGRVQMFSDSGSQRTFFDTGYSYMQAAAASAYRVIRRSEGTIGVATATGAGASFGGYTFEGFTGAAWGVGAMMEGVSNGAWSGANRGTELRFHVTENGAVALTEALRLNKTATAGQTALLLWDNDNAALERVTVGAADSGGVGYKVLRIPN